MPLYTLNSNPAALAQTAMHGASQAAASQSKQTTTKVKKESNFWEDLYKGAAALNMGAKAVEGIVGASGSIGEMYDTYRLREAYDNIDKAFAEGGFEAIQKNPVMQDYWHSQALGQFVKDRANSQKGYTEMLRNMDAAADSLYQNWRLQAMNAREAYNSGDMKTFMPAMQQLVANSPVPYRLEDNKNGKFRVMFRSDKHGGWADTGREMSPQEAFNEMNNILKGEHIVMGGVGMKPTLENEAFRNAARKSYWGTVMGNAENRIDASKQIPLYDASGDRSGVAVVQNPVDDYNSGPMLEVFGRDGKRIGVFGGYDEVMRHGLSPFKPQLSAGNGRRGSGESGAKSSEGYAGSGYRWTKDDDSAVTKYATVGNPETGEEEIDYIKRRFIKDFALYTGLSAMDAIAEYEESVNTVMARGESRQNAELRVRNEISKALSQGGAWGQTNAQAQTGAAQSQAQTDAQYARPSVSQGQQGQSPPVSNKTRDRINNALKQSKGAGNTADPGAEFPVFGAASVF